jgi:hypothetical protein
MKPKSQFTQLKDFFKSNMVSFENYYNKINNLYAFVPKKKYVEDLVDTDVSDDDDEEGDDSGDESDFYDEPFTCRTKNH